MAFTGERFTSAESGQIEIEHVHRYFLARYFCRGKDVLDVASGEGYGAALLAQVASSVIGVDVAEDAVEHAIRNYPRERLSFRKGAAEQLPLPDSSVDVVVSFETIEHLYDHDRFLAEIRRVLRPQGLLILSTPDRDIYSPPDQPSNPHHVHELTRREFFALLQRYFPVARFFGQRAVLGSVILADEPLPRADLPVVFEQRGEAQAESSHGLARATYLICIASDTDIGPLPESLFVYSGNIQKIFRAVQDLQAALRREHDSRARLQDEIQTVIERAEQERETIQVAFKERDLTLSALELRLNKTDQDREAASAALEQANLRLRQANQHRALLNAAVQEDELRLLQAEQDRAALDSTIEHLRRYLAAVTAQADQDREQLNSAIKSLQENLEYVTAQGDQDRAQLNSAIKSLHENLVSVTYQADHDRGLLNSTIRSLQENLTSVAAQADRDRASLNSAIENLREALAAAGVRAFALQRNYSALLARVRQRNVVQWLRELPRKRARIRRITQTIGRSPLFDSAWYLAQYADVRDGGLDPVLHYVRYGADEGRDPGPRFSTAYYIVTYPDILLSDYNPLEHYELFGRAEGRETMPAPDQSASHLIDLPSGELSDEPASDQSVPHGARAMGVERSEEPALDQSAPHFPRPISAEPSDQPTSPAAPATSPAPSDEPVPGQSAPAERLATSAGPSDQPAPGQSAPHFAPAMSAALSDQSTPDQPSAEERLPTSTEPPDQPDSDQYAPAERLPTSAEPSDQAPPDQSAPVERLPTSADPSDQAPPDESAPEKHLPTSAEPSAEPGLSPGNPPGEAEFLRGRPPAAVARIRQILRTVRASPLFDASWYLARYGDVQESGVDPAMHYVCYGAGQGRDPGPRFSTAFYIETYPDVLSNDYNPLEHYELFGRAEGRETVPLGRRARLELAAARHDMAAASSTVRGAPHVVFVSGEPHTPGHSYRIERYADAARAVGAEVAVQTVPQAAADLGAVESADLVFIWRAEWNSAVEDVVTAARRAGAPILFDVDDLMFDPDFARVPVIDGIRSQGLTEHEVQGLYLRMQRTMQVADFCSATTPFLTGHVRRWRKPSFVLPNGFDEATWRAARLAVRTRRNQGSDGLLRLGYAGGSRTHQKDFAIVAGALARILAERPECRLVLFRRESLNCLDLDEFPDLFRLSTQVEWRQLVPVHELPRELARFDINLAPLEVGNPFCESKSELKFFEAALAGVPSISSPTRCYAAAVRNGQTGILAETEDEWYEAMVRLLDDPALRERMARAAYLDVLWPFGPEHRAELMHSVLEQTLHRGRRAARAFELELVRANAPRAASPTIPETDTILHSDTEGSADVTVIVPVHNYANYLPDALDSVRDQTLPAIDLVVIDDCSTDNSLAVAREWIDRNLGRFNRVLLLRNRANAGLALTRNVGFGAAETPFVLQLDADNKLVADCAARCLEAIKATGAAFVYPTLRQFGDAEELFCEWPYDPAMLAGGNYIDATALVRLSAWAAVGGYDHVRFGWEDYDLWCRFAERGLYGHHVPEVLALYRVHGTSMLRTVTDIEENKRRLIADMRARHPWILEELYAVAAE